MSDVSTSTAGPVATVQRMIAAFGAGDLDALLETVHAESRWTYYGANPRLAAATFSSRRAGPIPDPCDTPRRTT